MAGDQRIERRDVAVDDRLLSARPDARRALGRDRFDVLRELRPALEPVPPRHDELRVGEREFPAAQLIVRRLLQSRMMLSHQRERTRVAGLRRLDELLRLFLVLVEIRSVGQFSGGHTNLLS